MALNILQIIYSIRNHVEYAVQEEEIEDEEATTTWKKNWFNLFSQTHKYFRTLLWVCKWKSRK